MSRYKRRSTQSQQIRMQPIAQSEHIPANDRFVLKEYPGFPLERGGIYAEMGADMTYEELTSFPSTGTAFSHYEQHEQNNRYLFFGIHEMLGIIFMLLGVFIVFISPFWFSAITFGMSLIAKRYHSTFIFITTVCFTIISFIFALYSLL